MAERDKRKRNVLFIETELENCKRLKKRGATMHHICLIDVRYRRDFSHGADTVLSKQLGSRQVHHH